MGYSSILKLINQGDFSEAKKRMNEYIDGNEVNDEDLKMLIDYYNATNSLFAGRILYRIQCSMGKYFDAYQTFVSLLSKTMRKELSLTDCVEKAELSTVEKMTEDLIEKLEDDLDIPQSLIVSQIYDVLEPKLYAAKQGKDYELIARMANNIWFEELKTSHYLYETAKSCIKVNDPLAEKVLQKMIQKEPANVEALNELGKIAEANLEFRKASLYYGRASSFSKDNEEYEKNYERVNGIINQQ